MFNEVDIFALWRNNIDFCVIERSTGKVKTIYITEGLRWLSMKLCHKRKGKQVKVLCKIEDELMVNACLVREKLRRTISSLLTYNLLIFRN
jgi:hypothetical protein